MGDNVCSKRVTEICDTTNIFALKDSYQPIVSCNYSPGSSWRSNVVISNTGPKSPGSASFGGEKHMCSTKGCSPRTSSVALVNNVRMSSSISVELVRLDQISEGSMRTSDGRPRGCVLRGLVIQYHAWHHIMPVGCGPDWGAWLGLAHSM